MTSTDPTQSLLEARGVTPPSAPISPGEKERLEAENRARLEDDLWTQRLEFRSLPRVVELQLSNFCNMSCTMCYDGVNPPMVKLAEDTVDYVAAKLFPHASVFVPFATSEPLIVTWDLTKRLAELYGIELEITTNVQFLDEKKFAELEPHVSVIELSIDSHIPEAYESIRLKSRPHKVFRNLPVAAKLCREHGIEAFANVVFMTENAPWLDETIAYLADAGVPRIHVQKMFYNKPTAHYSDPTVHFSKEWIEWMKQRCGDVAREKKVIVDLDFDGRELHDHLPEGTEFRETKAFDGWLETLRRYYPGYCPQSIYRLKIDNFGNAYPCCVGVEDRLKIGNVYENTVEEIWNGPESRDLRRAMLTQDLPAYCKPCNFRTGPILGEMAQRPFCDKHFIELESHPEQWRLEMTGPAHLSRLMDAPKVTWNVSDSPVDHYEIVFSAGGENADEVVEVDAGVTEWQIPQDLWLSWTPNMAYWWTIWAIHPDERMQTVRGTTTRCLIRHQPIPRIKDSTLDYDSVLQI